MKKSLFYSSHFPEWKRNEFSFFTCWLNFLPPPLPKHFVATWECVYSFLPQIFTCRKQISLPHFLIHFCALLLPSVCWLYTKLSAAMILAWFSSGSMRNSNFSANSSLCVIQFRPQILGNVISLNCIIMMMRWRYQNSLYNGIRRRQGRSEEVQ